MLKEKTCYTSQKNVLHLPPKSLIFQLKIISDNYPKKKKKFFYLSEELFLILLQKS